MSKIECNECHKTRHYARDFWSKTKSGSNQPNGNQVSKTNRRGHRGAQRGTSSPTEGDGSKVEGRICLSIALFDEHESWAGRTVGNERVASAEPTHGYGHRRVQMFPEALQVVRQQGLLQVSEIMV
jgi:hypothetical protein